MIGADAVSDQVYHPLKWRVIVGAIPFADVPANVSKKNIELHSLCEHKSRHTDNYSDRPEQQNISSSETSETKLQQIHSGIQRGTTEQ